MTQNRRRTPLTVGKPCGLLTSRMRVHVHRLRHGSRIHLPYHLVPWPFQLNPIRWHHLIRSSPPLANTHTCPSIFRGTHRSLVFIRVQYRLAFPIPHRTATMIGTSFTGFPPLLLKSHLVSLSLLPHHLGSLTLDELTPHLLASYAIQFFTCTSRSKLAHLPFLVHISPSNSKSTAYVSMDLFHEC